MTKVLRLGNRAIISIHGLDAYTFLQGLITHDIYKVSENHYTYAFMLTPQGRFLYDFFITKRGDEIFLDCQSARIDEIIRKFNMYKLRAAVQIINRSAEWQIYYSAEPLSADSIPDPRHEALGFRTITSAACADTISLEEYNLMRIAVRVPDADLDFIYERSLVLDYEALRLKSIDLHKGCYVGQEVVSRMHYRGNIRKHIYVVTWEGVAPQKGEELSIEGRKIGIFLGSSASTSLALLNIEEVLQLQCNTYITDARKITIKTETNNA